MKFIFNKIDAFHSKPMHVQMHLLLSALFILYLADDDIQNAIIKLPFIAVAFVFFLLSKEKRFQKFFWLTSTVVFFLDVLIDFTLIANHYFLFGFVSFIMFLSYTLSEKEQGEFLKKQTLIAFAIVMFFSGVQKLFSPQFMRGDVLGFLFVTDSFSSFMLDFFPVLHERITTNLETLNRFSNTDPLVTNQLVLHPVWNGFTAVSKYISWLVIALEIIIGIAAYFASKTNVFHWLVLALVVGIFAIRQECGFLVLAVILLLPSLTKKQIGYYKLYFSLIIIFMIFILADVAYG